MKQGKLILHIPAKRLIDNADVFFDIVIALVVC